MKSLPFCNTLILFPVATEKGKTNELKKERTMKTFTMKKTATFLLIVLIALMVGFGNTASAQQTKQPPKQTPNPQSLGAMSQQMSERQNAQNQAMQQWAERQKQAKEREKNLRGLQNSVSKIDSDIHKNRAKTSMGTNKQMQQLLLGN
jgi:TolA-binding protein